MLSFKRLGLTAILLLSLVSRAFAGPSQLLLGVGKSAQVSAAYVASAVDFDGSTDFLDRSSDFTGNSDGKLGIVSVWIRIDGGAGTGRHMVRASSNNVRVTVRSGDILQVKVENVGGTDILVIESTTTFSPGASWIHLLVAWDLNTPEVHLFIDGVDDEAGGATETDDTINYTNSDWGVGASASGASLFNGCISELYFNMDEFLDITIASNRDKFRDSATSKPVDLGSDGSTPTGTAPILYLNGDSTNFEINQGTGGDLTVNGTPSACSTSPTD